jgi:hypothetical protein
MVHGGSAFYVGGAFTNFVPAGGANRYRAPRGGTIHNLWLLVDQNSRNNPAEVVVAVNGAETSRWASIPAGSVANVEAEGDVPVEDGDVVAVRAKVPDGASGALRLAASYEFR